MHLLFFLQAAFPTLASGKQREKPRGRLPKGGAMKTQKRRTGAAVAAALIVLASQVAGAAWWEKGFDRWYYKDDWKAEFLRGARTYATTITIPGEIESAWVEVWAPQYTLRVNGETVGSDPDAGTIEAYDITEILHGGRNRIEISAKPEVIVDGGVVLKSGKIVPIRTDARWGRRIKTSRQRRSGPRGYAGDAHMALMLDYTPEQRAKAALSRLYSLIGRVGDRDLFRFWRVRDPGEVLRLEGPEYEILRRTAEEMARAKKAAAPAKKAAARGDWSEVERLLDSPRGARMIAARAASGFENAIAFRELRNDCKALEIQMELLGRANLIADPAWPVRLQRIESDLRRAAKMESDGDLLPCLVSQISGELAALRSEIERRLGIRLDRLNRSTQNRLGWIISNEPLDNDPRQWEFSFAPPSAEVLDLAGLWRFRLDPEDKGTSAGFGRTEFDDSAWNAIFAPYKWGWERLGYDRDNPLNPGKNNKPYNGHAWYRKRFFVPKSWAGRDLELDLGVAGNNQRWVYFNGRLIGKPEGNRAGENTWSTRRTLVIPAGAVRAGATNTIAIHVFNPENVGGLLGPRLEICPAGKRPKRLRTVCQAGIVQVAEYPGGGRQAAYCGALSPAVLVSQSERRFRVWGWEAKGYRPPALLAYLGGRQERIVTLKEGLSIGGDALDRGWLMVAPRPVQKDSPSRPQVLLIVFQRRPTTIRWESDETGGKALVMDFATSPGVIALVRPFGRMVPIVEGPGGRRALRTFTDSLCNRWVRLMRAYPTCYAELYREIGEKAFVWLGYDFFETDDDWGTEHVRHAPMPMLFSYARENGWPGTSVEIAGRLSPGAASTPDPSATYCGGYMARIGSPILAYAYDRREPRVRWKGIGTFLEIRNMGDRDFETMRSWGANACRPQIAFQSDWFVKGFFERDKKTQRSGLEGKLLWDRSAVEWLDGIVALHRRHGITCILNWFWNADYPLKELNGAPPNSARYWRRKPEARRLIIDFWAKVAEHYASLPRDATAYDLLNEPATLPYSEYNLFIKDATATIRKFDKVHTIFVESANGWAQPEDFDRLEPTGDPNTVYEFHFYGPHTFGSYSHDIWFPRYDRAWESYRSWESLEERLLPPLRFSIRNGGAELCHGEFGITFLGPDEAPRRWLEDLLTLHEKYRNHWIWWNWDGSEIHRTGLVAGNRINPLVTTLSRFMKTK